MKTAGSRTIAEWTEASKMPPLAFVLERTAVEPQYPEYRRPSIDDFERLGKRAGVTPEQVQEWLEAGKDAQREHLAKLAADPEWRAMAARLGGFPGLVVKPSQVPRDPKERKAWSHRRAKEGGWL